MLWSAVVNSILIDFENKIVKVIAYANDVVIFMFPEVFSYIMSTGLDLLSS